MLRNELIGKRFLSISSDFNISDLTIEHIHTWPWCRGFIRAANHRDPKITDLQVFVEYDDRDLETREWISVYCEGLFHCFLVEDRLVVAERPALAFEALLSSINLPSDRTTVEYLLDKKLEFCETVCLQPLQGNEVINKEFENNYALKYKIRNWLDFQNSQRIFLTTPSILIGYRVQVYRLEGKTQWYTAVIVGYNESTQEMVLTDDTVLEEHIEDPSLIQINIIDTSVIESIMKGEDLKISSRRSRNSIQMMLNSPFSIQNRSRKQRSIESNCDIDKGKLKKKKNGTQSKKDTTVLKEKHVENISGNLDNFVNSINQDKNDNEDIVLRIKDQTFEDVLLVPNNNCSVLIKSCDIFNQNANNFRLNITEKSKSLQDIELVKSTKLIEDENKTKFSINGTCRDDDEESSLAPSPFRMELNDSNVSNSLLLRDDRSDSGLSSLRSSSGDERSGSRSSALSGTEELQISSTNQNQSINNTHTNNSHVWRDPNVVIDSDEPHIRHIQSVQHQTLLMSHHNAQQLIPQTRKPTASPQLQSSEPSQAQTQRSQQTVSCTSQSVHNQPTAAVAAAAASVSMHLTPTPATPAPIHSNHSYSQLPPDLMWKQRYQTTAAGQIIPSTTLSHLLTSEENINGERNYLTDKVNRFMREKRDFDYEKSINKERELLHHQQQQQQQQQRDRLVKDQIMPQTPQPQRSSPQQHLNGSNGNNDLDLGRERQEKSRAAEQAVHKHFEESLRLAHQKQREQKNQQGQSVQQSSQPSQPQQHIVPNWNTPSSIRSHHTVDDERKRILDQELQQKNIRRDVKDRNFYSQTSSQTQQRIPIPQAQVSITRQEYVPPLAHSSRLKSSPINKPVQQQQQQQQQSLPQSQPQQQLITSLPKAEPNFNIFGYNGTMPPYSMPSNYLPHEQLATSKINKPISSHGGGQHQQQQGHNTSTQQYSFGSGLVVTKSAAAAAVLHLDREKDLLLKNNNSVIVKNSPSPIGTSQHVHNYNTTIASNQKSMSFDYRRSPTNEPLRPLQNHHNQSQLHFQQMQSQQQQQQQQQRSLQAQILVNQTPSQQRYQMTPHSLVISQESKFAGNQTYPNSKLPYMPTHISISSYNNIANPTQFMYQQQQPQQQHFNNLNSNNINQTKSTKVPNRTVQQSQVHSKPPSSLGNASNTQTKPEKRVLNPVLTSASPYSYSNLYNYLPIPLSRNLKNVKSSDSVFHQTPDVQISNSIPSIIDNTSSSSSTVSKLEPLNLQLQTSEKSPKRELQYPTENLVDVKKRKLDVCETTDKETESQQLQLSRVEEAVPLVSNATAATITTVINTAAIDRLSLSPSDSPNKLNDVVVLPKQVPLTETVKQTALSDSLETVVESTEGSRNNYVVCHFKKDWIHNYCVDSDDDADVVGSGSCITLPLKLEKPKVIVTENLNCSSTTIATTISTVSLTSSSSTSSLQSIGSMAVNSINKSKSTNSFKNRRLNTKPVNNGTVLDSSKLDESSSSDDDSCGEGGSNNNRSVSKKVPLKKKTSKVKRKKTQQSTLKKHSSSEEPRKKKIASSGNALATRVVSDSSSDSGADIKESDSDKESDSGASLISNDLQQKRSFINTVNNNNNNNGNNNEKQPKKRGRRPRALKNPDNNNVKKGKEESVTKSTINVTTQAQDSFKKPSISQLKKTGESFLQDGACFEVAPKLAKCRECRWTPNQRSKNMSNIFCRFYAFRRLKYTKSGQLAIAGFSDPHKEAYEEDLKLWMPSVDVVPKNLDDESAIFILRQMVNQFCQLLDEEKQADCYHLSEDDIVAWKRVVQGVREMCDVCETTLFNFHWVCNKCGFVVCLDCYKLRKNGHVKWDESSKIKDEYSWLYCMNKQTHEKEKLMLTQIIAGNSLIELGILVHKLKGILQLQKNCRCDFSEKLKRHELEVTTFEALKRIFPNEVDKMRFINGDLTESISVRNENNSNKSCLSEVKFNVNKSDNNSDLDSKDDKPFPSLKQFLARNYYSSLENSADEVNDVDCKSHDNDILNDENCEKTCKSVELKYFKRKSSTNFLHKLHCEPRTMSLKESKDLYPDIPHNWLCDGKLLTLYDPSNVNNIKLFQEQWRRGQPILMTKVSKNLNMEKWLPKSLLSEFADEKNEFVNCVSSNVISITLKKFWDGFEYLSKRLRDDRGNPMLLKLSNWPSTEDLLEILPKHVSDLSEVLPFEEYTSKTGKLNLASRIPECFVKPDLGPKLYIDYGSAVNSTKAGTINLQLGVSDSVHVLIYVGIPKDGDYDSHVIDALKTIDLAGCDNLTKRRVRDNGELPGALWHIYDANDADKIRDFLNKIAFEQGAQLTDDFDPVHEQSFYLDATLRERLTKEYGVESYTIAQCQGDAIFIPSGCPYQVKNLHNCIKAAEDFISPEHIDRSLFLTNEYNGNEDRLQIKNIIYHTIKDCVSVLLQKLANSSKTVS